MPRRSPAQGAGGEVASQQLPVVGLQLGSHHAAQQLHLPELAELLQTSGTARHTLPVATWRETLQIL